MNRVREELLNRLPEINNEEELLRRSKNELFSYFKNEFGLYKEQEQEMRGEIEIRKGRK